MTLSSHRKAGSRAAPGYGTSHHSTRFCTCTASSGVASRDASAQVVTPRSLRLVIKVWRFDCLGLVDCNPSIRIACSQGPCHPHALLPDTWRPSKARGSTLRFSACGSSGLWSTVSTRRTAQVSRPVPLYSARVDGPCGGPDRTSEHPQFNRGGFPDMTGSNFCSLHLRCDAPGEGHIPGAAPYVRPRWT